MNYKILASDVDGTLLGNNHEMPEVNVTAINKAIAKGVKFVLCSGRSDTSLVRFFNNIGIEKKGNFIISLNGGELLSMETGEVIRRVPFDYVKMFDIISKVRETGALAYPIVYYTSKQIYSDCDNALTRRYERMSGVRLDIVDLEKTVRKDVSKLLFLGEPEEIKKVNQFLSDKLPEGINMFGSGRTYLDFTCTGGEKGTALEYLSEMQGIPLSKTIGIGDNENDINLIQKAGLGVAVANATDDVKAYADYVTENDNDNGAVAEVVEKFIFK